MFGLSKKEKLEKKLMKEIKEFAGVEGFPLQDAKTLSRLIQAYNSGDTVVITAAVSGSMATLEKYPALCSNWDDIMLKYHELGLFSDWQVK